MKSGRRFAISAVIAVAMLAVAGCQQTQQIKAATPDPALSSAGRNFVDQVQQQTAAERALATVARDESTNKSIKQYADMMIKDDTQSLQKLSDLEQKYKLKEPAASDAAQSKEVEQLKRSSRRTLDKEFLKLSTDDEDKLLKAVKDEANSAADPDLRDYANNLLPVLENEVKAAEKLQPHKSKRPARS